MLFQRDIIPESPARVYEEVVSIENVGGQERKWEGEREGKQRPGLVCACGLKIISRNQRRRRWCCWRRSRQPSSLSAARIGRVDRKRGGGERKGSLKARFCPLICKPMLTLQHSGFQKKKKKFTRYPRVPVTFFFFSPNLSFYHKLRFFYVS